MLKAIEEEPEEIEKFVEKVRSEELFDSNKEAKKSEEEQGNKVFKMEENRPNEADRISEKVNE